MIAHLVLLQPRADLTESQRATALQTIRASLANSPDVRRARLGRRVLHGLPGYEAVMTQDFSYALMLEFDDLDGLERYLEAPAHQALGQLFYSATSAALAYDYTTEELRG